MHLTTHPSDIPDTEQQVHDLQAEIARLQLRRRAVQQRLGKMRERVEQSGGTYRAASTFKVEREQIDERIAVLRASAQSIQERNKLALETSVYPTPRVDETNAPSSHQHQSEQTVVRTPWLTQSGIYQKWRTAPRQTRSRFLWTIGNALMRTVWALIEEIAISTGLPFIKIADDWPRRMAGAVIISV